MLLANFQLILSQWIKGFIVFLNDYFEYMLNTCTPVFISIVIQRNFSAYHAYDVEFLAYMYWTKLILIFHLSHLFWWNFNLIGMWFIIADENLT